MGDGGWGRGAWVTWQWHEVTSLHHSVSLPWLSFHFPGMTSVCLAGALHVLDVGGPSWLQ